MNSLKIDIFGTKINVIKHKNSIFIDLDK